MELHVGNLHLQYENGFLRYICAGNTEIVRMIYFAVRDKDWGTIPGKLLNEKIEHTENGFTISYEMEFEQDNIRMHWIAGIEGKRDNTIIFDIKGKALSTFQKNRTGFCLLHPIKECRGKEVIITHVNEFVEEYTFPYHISPHQPFKNIQKMQWRPASNCSAEIICSGDIFETEDQRNWMDNSYKTYCTPLEIPLPATLHEGDEVHQQIVLKVACSEVTSKKAKEITITATDERMPIPAIGIARAAERNEYYHKTLEFLSSFSFTHYRVDIILSNTNWKQTLTEAAGEAKLINCPLEIALYIREESKGQLNEFVQAINTSTRVKQIILLQENASFISNDLLHTAHQTIATVSPHILIGAGSDDYFTELNRSDLDTSIIDFVSYPANPQVHASDDLTLIENCEAQAYTVETALHRYKKPVFVSPVTLKVRYNPAETAKNATAIPMSDERQSTRFCAAWTLGSLKYLVEAGTASVTYFETVGNRGLIADDEGQTPFPVLEVFKYLPGNITYARKSISSHPLICNSLIVGNSKEEYLLVANYSNNDIEVVLKGQLSTSSFHILALEVLTIKL